MIMVDGDQLRVSGGTRMVTAELAYLLRGVCEQLEREKTQAYACSAMEVSQARARRQDLDELKKNALREKEREYRV